MINIAMLGSKSSTNSTPTAQCLKSNHWSPLSPARRSANLAGRGRFRATSPCMGCGASSQKYAAVSSTTWVLELLGVKELLGVEP